jgi:hypothetical protein
MYTIKIGVCLKHDDALKCYQDTGAGYPTIPPGKNTVWHHFKTMEGKHAVIINQRGFKRFVADNEEEVNGCTVAIVLDDVPETKARAMLEKWVTEQLEIKK